MFPAELSVRVTSKCSLPEGADVSTVTATNDSKKVMHTKLGLKFHLFFAAFDDRLIVLTSNQG